MKTIHPQSLLRIPLIDFVIHQNEAKIIERPVDSTWNYKQIFTISTVGFNPFCGNLFCAKNSALNNWLPHAHKSAKSANKEEWLLYECLFLVHDYLHLWAVSELIRDLPGLNKPIIMLDEKTIADLEFVYMISEAVATVGLDYWYLSKINLNDICPIGTRIIGLTSPYREADLDRYKKLNGRFNVQDPLFFDWLVTGYCKGDFYGFSLEDLQKDNKLFNWLGKEIKIGNKQLHFIRLWLYYMAGWNYPPDVALNAPIDLNLGDRENIVKKIGQKLWDISNGTELPVMQAFKLKLKNSKPITYTDFRFKNLHRLDNWQDLNWDFTATSIDQFKYFVAQFLSSFCFKESHKVTKTLIDEIVNSKDILKLKELTQNFSLVESEGAGPENLVFVN